ncbi:opsin, ultraviolet-sensitive-like isoform X3 [Zootermopsis nevadensis]|uniref:opsin, ultraviolet-sensitive-like isoform X3 n=1 Tax=Zootermopsis nevadensis TaxID=136037 RepID=UPI000B8ED700|nr:opsin, ultraviolet-sensitive-like isoform X3 [Zootermopsis nevadensis]
MSTYNPVIFKMELQGIDYSNLSLFGPDARVAPRLMGWNVPVEELIHIPSHWLSFPEVDPMMHYSLGLLYCFFCVAALVGNGLVIWIFSTTIARPFHGRVTRGRAVVMLVFVWAYTLPWAVMPALEIWGRFVPEGYLTSCSFDYLTKTPENQFFVVTIFIFSYILPMSLIIYFYSQIVSHVVNHEKALREQAKKMNVESLRSNQQQNQVSAEIRIAKAAISICFLFVASWTPYAVMALIGAFGNQALLTPGASMIPALTCKFVACLDPYVYAISHPRYRVELQKRLPWLNIDETQPQSETTSAITTNVSTDSTGTPD